jgi:hypothetical protein
VNVRRLGVRRKLRRFLRLSSRERGTFLAAFLLLHVARLTLWLTGLRGAAAVFGWFVRPGVRVTDEAERHRRHRLSTATFRLVRAASRFAVCRANCLPQALVTRLLLQRQGIEPELRFGARKYAGSFQAHAWLQLDSLVLDAGSGSDVPFAPFGGDRPL